MLHVDDVFGGLSSIIELSSVDFSIFPNPSNGKFWIDVNHSVNNYRLRLYSILGDLVYDSKVINSNDFESIELNIASGVYVVELSEGIRSSRKKLVIN